MNNEKYNKSDYRAHVFEDNEDMKQYNFVKADLRGVDLSNRDLTAVNFSAANLGGTKFVGSILNGANFSDTTGSLPDKWKVYIRIVFLTLSFSAGLIICYSLSLILVVIAPPEDLGKGLEGIFSNFSGYPVWMGVSCMIALFVSIFIEYSLGVGITLIAIIVIVTIIAIVIMSLPIQDQTIAGAASILLTGFLGTISGLLARAQSVSLKEISRKVVAKGSLSNRLITRIDWTACFLGIAAGVASVGHERVFSGILAFILILLSGYIGSKSSQGNSKYSVFYLSSLKLVRIGNITDFRNAHLDGAKFNGTKLKLQYIDIGERTSESEQKMLSTFFDGNEIEIAKGAAEMSEVSGYNRTDLMFQFMKVGVELMSKRAREDNVVYHQEIHVGPGGSANVSSHNEGEQNIAQNGQV
ncbi:low-complexity protein [Leptolyngbya sp. Heron Island J]|uniref:pentapeptide repeat-containing protein n=1 Tax=Leptolyngbya sp. Heron Island J TaxID=1385935 RepID=UPI0003B983BC|nr:pentapeptide repeat-containing protein [Leptolyngbya sp. Heron Island J]ESA33823.1 low-complexity protein [Leptolyngbya sp. Heron Island J]